MKTKFGKGYFADDKNNPCYDCLNRHLNCHSECGAHQNWKAKLDIINEARKKEELKDRFCYKTDNKRPLKSFAQKFHSL